MKNEQVITGKVIIHYQGKIPHFGTLVKGYYCAFIKTHKKVCDIKIPEGYKGLNDIELTHIQKGKQVYYQ